MAHALEIVNGEGQMFSVKEMPWHGLGKVLDDAPSIKEGIIYAGLDWEVECRQLATFRFDAENNVELDTVVDRRAIVRKDTNAHLATCGSIWTPVQNLEAFEFFEPFIESGAVELESAGSLHGGRHVWVMAKVKAEDNVIVKAADDRVSPYILLHNAHDGNTRASVGFTPVRVVCQNTLNMALKDGGSSLFRIKHTKNVKVSLEKLRETMDIAKQTFDINCQQYRALSKLGFSEKELLRYIRIVFNRDALPKAVTIAKVDEKAGIEPGKLEARVIELFQHGRGNDAKGVRGTRWAAYNAIVEYLQYERGDDAEQRFQQLWFDNAKRMTQRALTIAAGPAWDKIAA